MQIKTNYKISLLLIIILTILSFSSWAQDTTKKEKEKPILEYINGNKYIHVDQLYFSPNMTVWEFLQLFPELTTRGSDDVLNNYTIIMDDYSLGNNRDEILYQMTLGELSTIVITNNPSVAYSNGGIGGAITLIPKALTDGLSGNAQLDVCTEKNILASTNINYKKNKWRIRSYLKGEYGYYQNKYTTEYFGSVRPDMKIRNNTNNILETNELAKFSVECSATDKDELSLTIWESYSYQKLDQYVEYPIIKKGEFQYPTKTDSLGTLARFTYSHAFNPYHLLSVGINYSYAYRYKIDNDTNKTYSQPHSVEVDLRYIGALLHKEKHNLTFVTGLDFSNSLTQLGKPAAYSDNYISLSPLMELRYTWTDKLFIRTGARYYYDKYLNFAENAENFSAGHDYMVSSEIDYTPAQGHTIRAGALRDRICSDEGQPIGYLAAADISYIFQKSFNKHFLNVGAGFEYDRAQMNSGITYNVFSVNASFLWQYKWICLSLTGNLFDNASNRKEFDNYHLYYNLRFTSIFTLPKNWSISANFMYNSPLISRLSIEGDYIYASLRVCKKIGAWSIHADLFDPFHYKTTDYFYNAEIMLNHDLPASSKSYYPYRWSVNLGVMFEF